MYKFDYPEWFKNVEIFHFFLEAFDESWCYKEPIKMQDFFYFGENEIDKLHKKLKEIEHKYDYVYVNFCYNIDHFETIGCYGKKGENNDN